MCCNRLVDVDENGAPISGPFQGSYCVLKSFPPTADALTLTMTGFPLTTTAQYDACDSLGAACCRSVVS